MCACVCACVCVCVCVRVRVCVCECVKEKDQKEVEKGLRIYFCLLVCLSRKIVFVVFVLGIWQHRNEEQRA